MRDRLWHGDWIAVGVLNGETTIVPRIENAKFGRKPSAMGDGVVNYSDVRILHSALLEAITRAAPVNAG